jgi:hypothetical protein
MHGVAALDWAEASSVRRFRPVPRDGDVLVSKRSSRADVYTISVIPATEYKLARQHSEAIEAVRELARQRQVDGWFTCNHRHFARIAAYRPQHSDVNGTADSRQNRSF